MAPFLSQKLYHLLIISFGLFYVCDTDIYYSSTIAGADDVTGCQLLQKYSAAWIHLVQTTLGEQIEVQNLIQGHWAI